MKCIAESTVIDQKLIYSFQYNMVVSFYNIFSTLISSPQSTLIENLKAARPTFVMTVPRMWEKINEYLETRVSTNDSRFKHKLLNRARKVALTHYTAISEG